MKLLLGALVLLPVVLLVVGSIRGRVRVTSCCSLPAQDDARMAAAYAATPATDASPVAKHVPASGSAH